MYAMLLEKSFHNATKYVKITSGLSITIQRGSYMSAHVLLNLLTIWGRDKMRDLLSLKC